MYWLSLNFSQIYWLGDLNYRITDMDPRVVKDWIKNENYSKILDYDQLVKQCRSQTVFVGFKEGTINFRPTYKYDMGTDNWDSRSVLAIFSFYLLYFNLLSLNPIKIKILR